MMRIKTQEPRGSESSRGSSYRLQSEPPAPMTSSNELKQEILGIDLLRFLAALMVMAFHLGFYNFFGIYNFWTEGAILPKMLGSSDIAHYLGPFSYFGWVGVEVFFVISGFVIAYSAEEATAFSFFRSRFIRLMPGVWLCSIASLPAAYYVRQQSVNVIAKLFAKSIILYPPGPYITGVLWTLPVEISFYCIVLFLIYRRMYKHIAVVTSIIGSYSAAFWLLYAFSLTQPRLSSVTWRIRDIAWNWYMQVSLVHYGCFFSVGVFLWLGLVRRKTNLTFTLLPLILAGCSCELYYVNWTKTNDTKVFQPAAVPVAIWFVCVGLIILSVIFNEAIGKRLKSFSGGAIQKVKWVGQATYPLYLLHLPVSLFATYLLSLAHANQYVAWTSGALAAFVVSAFVTTYIEPPMKIRMKKSLTDLYNRFSRARRLPA